jgi:chromosome partitioning protein
LLYLKTNARVSDADTPTNYIPNTSLAGIVPFIVRTAGRAASGFTNIHTEQLAALRRQWGADVLTTEGKYYTGIAESINDGWPVWNLNYRNVTRPVKNMMTAICTDLKTRIDR